MVFFGRQRLRYRERSRRSGILPASFVGVFLIAVCCIGNTAVAQESNPGQEAADRLKKGVDNADSADNQYRGGAGSLAEVIQNMKDLAKPIWKEVPDQTLDKWYSPHLPDLLFPMESRKEQAEFRSKAGAEKKDACLKKGQFTCTNGAKLFGPPNQTACPLCQRTDCGNIPWPHPEHLADECCKPTPRGTGVYELLTNDSNFKACCVRDGTKGGVNETRMFEERIACRHPTGDGWAGIFEYYYPTTIIGLENQRGETMLATKQEVNKCIEESDRLMENQQAVDFVAESIKNSQKVAGGSQGGDNNFDEAKVKQQVQEDIKKVRPTDKKLRFSDSLAGRGLTARPFLPAYDRAGMTKLALHFCMRPEQFHKLLHPLRDKIQLRGSGGTSPEQIAQTVPIWANYCPEGVELMTKVSNSEIANVDETDTRFMLGMQAWKQDPLYCQNMHRNNPNMRETKITDVLEKSGGGSGQTPAAVGYTCVGPESNLDNSMVPQAFNKSVPVERRTAWVDHGLGFLIAGGLFPPKWLAPGDFPGSFRSMYKRFEPQPYSMTAATGYQTFWGKKFAGKGTNEVANKKEFTKCTPLTGRNYNTNGMPGNQGNSDQLFLSDKTHESFTQSPIVNAQGKRGAFDRYVQDWSKGSDDSKQKIKERKLDKEAHNYGVAFRIFKTCPEGYSRWRPLDPHGVLAENLDTFCGEENFGSPRQH